MHAVRVASNDYDELFFTSSRDGSLGKSADGFSGNSYTDIYWSKYDKKKNNRCYDDSSCSDSN